MLLSSNSLVNLGPDWRKSGASLLVTTLTVSWKVWGQGVNTAGRSKGQGVLILQEEYTLV